MTSSILVQTPRIRPERTGECGKRSRIVMSRHFKLHRMKCRASPESRPMVSTVQMEDFGGVSFQSMWEAFSSAAATLDNGHGATLQTVASNITDASQAFQQSLATQEAKNEWVGKTHEAAMQNINESLPNVSNISSGANALGFLIDAFSHTVFQTQWYFDENHNAYTASLDHWPNETDEINGVYDSICARRNEDRLPAEYLKYRRQYSRLLYADKRPGAATGPTDWLGWWRWLGRWLEHTRLRRLRRLHRRTPRLRLHRRTPRRRLT